jgi:RNA polymerase sigma-70 factor (ECF subfamily)
LTSDGERATSTGRLHGLSAGASEADLVAAICSGDEDAWIQLVRRYGPTMHRIALLYVPDTAVAEEVVQETWLAVLTGIRRFEGRSSFKTWLFRILTNRAQRRAAVEGRSLPFSALSKEEVAAAESSVDSDRFRGIGELWTDFWTSSPHHWTDRPEASLLTRETLEIVERVVALLPPAQRTVVTLRDILGWDADEVCDLLSVTASYQRVLLHRARTKVRRALEEHFAAS